MNQLSRRVFLAGAAATTAVTLGQFNRKNRVSAQTQEINLYSSRHYNTDNALYENFTTATGIKVNLIEGNADELIERIKSEGQNSPADILMTVDVTRLWRADQEGIFTPVSSAILTEKIPANLRHPEGHWFAFSKRARVIMYHKDRVNPAELSTYEDLADPKWKGKIAIRSSDNSYNQALVASIIAANGEEKTQEWTQGLVANFARPPEGNDTAQIEAVAAGIADLAIANTYYLANLGQSEEPQKQEIFKTIGIFFPNQQDRGAHVNISGGGLLKTAPNPEGGVKFLEYLVSEEAQKFFAEGNNEYPVVEGVPIAPIIAGFGEFKSDSTAIAELGPLVPPAVQVMDRAGWK
ncbi:Fe(3+) ABC transporter substrate-binding protein [Gloeocapsa sp. PCC 73106]|uniref:Fe(3+) ABC transporter substrate-binding protein n=1 Tax=Gloeocapsa sp. PCC 73106 TaxID=102232 RepID=UPI0002ACCDCF|nr:Fe(3+) ABC transporter substrate-binding protein [Gloeocapsa sp. PCC 73106]ELR96445.1 ABC-type Fe3+ transport system, periplasmic component [Gloeocapsa sp. PCC 73106]